MQSASSMSHNDRDILSDAVARNTAVVPSLPSAGMLRHCKTRVLGNTDDGVWLESIPAEHVLIEELVTTAQPCGVSFKCGDQKVSFAAKVMKLEPAYRVNADTAV